MYHFPKYDKEQKREKEEQIKERKRTRRRRRKEKILKPSWKEQTQQATFPVLVERSKASPPRPRQVHQGLIILQSLKHCTVLLTLLKIATMGSITLQG